jgi:hypothetical protein
MSGMASRSSTSPSSSPRTHRRNHTLGTHTPSPGLAMAGTHTDAVSPVALAPGGRNRRW